MKSNASKKGAFEVWKKLFFKKKNETDVEDTGWHYLKKFKSREKFLIKRYVTNTIV